MVTWVTAISAVVCLVVGFPVYRRIALRAEAVQANFLGDPVPVAAGIVVVGTACLILLAASGWQLVDARMDRLWIIALVSFGMLGLIDDWLGDSQVRGVRGHVRALLRERRLTTGLVKAVGGLAAAWYIAWQFDRSSDAAVCLNGLLIALSANAVNLLDLRPGRASAAFLAVAVSTGAAVWRFWPGRCRLVLPLAALAAPTLVEWCYDRQALLMLGDVGSNALGAAMAMGLLPLPYPVRVMSVILLVTMHLIGERYSLSACIERYPVLRTLDRLTGIRARGPAAPPDQGAT